MTEPWHTRLGRPSKVLLAEASPALAYHKWHAFDPPGQDDRLTAEGSRVGFLAAVAESVERARARSYAAWHASYCEALEGLGLPPRAEWLAGATVWRLVAGFATNPALETGVVLHPLHGFPHLPGSAVRGLVHHVAETALLEQEARRTWPGSPAPPEDPALLGSFLDEAEQVKALFGSLSVELSEPQKKLAAAGAQVAAREEAPSEDEDPSPDPPPETPRSLLARWQTRLREAGRRAEHDRVHALLAGHTGGLAAFYDAVPDPGERDLLQLDILNPHYPDYYRSEGKDAPSDDQSPTPIYFLAVRPGTRFSFPLRLAAWPREPGRDPAEKERIALLHGLSRDQAGERLRAWLRQGLETSGAGAKTAAGYGYFTFDAPRGRAIPAERAERSERAAPPVAPRAGANPSAMPRKPPRGREWERVPQRSPGARNPRQPPPRGPEWERRVESITKLNCAAEVPSLLASLSDQERTKAAIKLVQKLGTKYLRGQTEEWALALLHAAGMD